LKKLIQKHNKLPEDFYTPEQLSLIEEKLNPYSQTNE